eukprot:1195160-Prorocentrum_minimum.AAC.13
MSASTMLTPTCQSQSREGRGHILGAEAYRVRGALSRSGVTAGEERRTRRRQTCVTGFPLEYGETIGAGKID